MAPPPYIPSLEEEGYDNDVAAGLQGLLQKNSDELFEPDKPRGATDPKHPQTNDKGQVGPQHRSLPSRLPDYGSGNPAASSTTGWTQLVDSPDPIPSTSDPPLPQISQPQPTVNRQPRRPSTQLTTIYSSSGPQHHQHDPAAPSISIPTARSHQLNLSPAHPHHPRHFPPQARRQSSLLADPSHLDYFRHGDPRSPPPVLHTLPRPTMSSRTVVPASTEGRNDDSQESSSAQPQSSSSTSGTTVLSGGVIMGTSEYASIASPGPLSPTHPRRPQHQPIQQQQLTSPSSYSRASTGLPVGQPGPPPFQPPLQPGSFYTPQEYTRATPSPVFVGSPYGISFQPPQPHMLRPAYGIPYPHPQQPPPLHSEFPSFSQAYGHIGVSPEMMAYTPIYSQQQQQQQSYVPSPAAEAGPGHSPVVDDGNPGYAQTHSHSHSPHTRPALPGGSPSGGRSSGGRSSAQTQPPPPAMHFQSPPPPHILPHSQQVSPSHVAAFAPAYSSPSNSPYGAPAYTYPPYSHPTSPVPTHAYGQYPSPHMDDSRTHYQPPPPPTQGGTWWYVPPGGGPPQPYPGQSTAAYDYQGPFTMTYSQQSQQPQPPQPQQQALQVAETAPARQTTSSFKGQAPRGGHQRGAPRTRGSYGRGGGNTAGATRVRGQFSRPRGGGPSGAGLAAGSPSGGSVTRSHPTSSDSANNPALKTSDPAPPPVTQPFTPGMVAIRKGKEPVRQAFHPKPQTHGHEWVMWVGNIPDHATQNEVWNFFRNPQAVAFYMAARGNPAPQPAPAEPLSSGSDPPDGGVSSVFLIKSSNCAFVNFETEDALKRAMRTFNGVPLRPYDTECPPLVCRIRRKDDDLRTGVAAQRGWGLHTNWIRLQAEAMRKAGLVPETPARKGKARATESSDEAEKYRDGPDGVVDGIGGAEPGSSLESSQIVVPPHLRSHDDPPTSPSTHLGPSSNSDPSPPIFSKFTGPDGRPLPLPHQSSSASSGSYTSTNSSFLMKYFPKRYFILKSLSEYDLNLSVERGVWATQPHNEPILDQAFRTSKEVYLIFGANKSGEFFGYARMISGISKNDRKVPWASRSDSVSGSSRSGGSPGVLRQRSSYSVIVEDPAAEEGRQDRPSSPSPLPTKAASAQAFESLAPLAASPSPMAPNQAATLPSPVPHNHTTRLMKDAAVRSAPPEMGAPHHRVSRAEQPPAGGTDLGARMGALNLGAASAPGDSEPKLDPSAPFRAAKKPELLDDKAVTEEDLRRRELNEGSSLASAIAEMDRSRDGDSSGAHPTESWGGPFRIQWIKTDRLPFVRVKHLRNPWNYDREVKISRDGIELEPSVGEALLQEWDKLEAERDEFQRALATTYPQRGQGPRPQEAGPSSASELHPDGAAEGSFGNEPSTARSGYARSSSTLLAQRGSASSRTPQ